MIRIQRGSGQPRRSLITRPAVWAFASLVLATSACNSSTTGPDVEPSTPGPSTTPSRGSLSEIATDESTPSREDQVAKLWVALHEERLTQIHRDAPSDGSRFADLATAEGVELAVSLVEAGRSDVSTELVDTEFWPSIEIAANGTEASVSDCILVAERPAASPDAEPTVRSQVWRGEAVETQGGWRISDFHPGAADCISPALNDELLIAYQQWDRAKNEWWDPPDPDDPRLAETMVQPGLDGMRQLLARHREMGIVLRDHHDPGATAVIVELAIGRARVADCYPATLESLAAFDAESGERRIDLSPEPTPGQTDYMIVDFVRTAAGEWKAAGHRSGQDSDCVPGETTYVVAP